MITVPCQNLSMIICTAPNQILCNFSGAISLQPFVEASHGFGNDSSKLFSTVHTASSTSIADEVRRRRPFPHELRRRRPLPHGTQRVRLQCGTIWLSRSFVRGQTALQDALTAAMRSAWFRMWFSQKEDSEKRTEYGPGAEKSTTSQSWEVYKSFGFFPTSSFLSSLAFRRMPKTDTFHAILGLTAIVLLFFIRF